jgi:sugar phosphate isomerase/epimerase
MLSGYFFLDQTIEDMACACRYAGMLAVELFDEQIAPLPSAQRLAFLKALRELGIKVASYHLPMGMEEDISHPDESCRQRAVHALQRALDRAALCNAPSATFHPTTAMIAMPAPDLRHRQGQLQRSLECLLPHATADGVSLALENLSPAPRGARLGSEPAHFSRLPTAFPELRYCFDTGHAAIACGPDGVVPFAQQLAPKISLIHLSDNPGDRDLHLPPGNGAIDWSSFFRFMRQLPNAPAYCIEAPPFAPGPRYAPAAWRELALRTRALAEQEAAAPYSLT